MGSAVRVVYASHYRSTTGRTKPSAMNPESTSIQLSERKGLPMAASGERIQDRDQLKGSAIVRVAAS